MKTKLTYFTLGMLALCAAVVFIVISKKNAEIKSLKTQLEMEQISSSEMKQRIKDEREGNNKFGWVVSSLRDSIEFFKIQQQSQDKIISQLNREKNEIKKTDYSNRNDSELSSLLLQLFAEQDSVSRP